MVTPDVKRNAVAHVCAQHGVSQRRACEVSSFDRSPMRYRSVRPDDVAIRKAMKKVASERRRFGYRRIHVMLDRQGIVMNLKKLRRLYREKKPDAAQALRLQTGLRDEVSPGFAVTPQRTLEPGLRQ